MKKLLRTINYWTEEPVEVPPFNIHGFHRVGYGDVILGFFTYGNRTAETLTADDIRFFIGFFFQGDDTGLAFDIVGRDAVHSPVAGMHDSFLRIRKSRNKAKEVGV